MLRALDARIIAADFGVEAIPAMPAKERSAPRPELIETVCPRCGGAFACCPEGPCWCGEETFKLPRDTLEPALGCYCPACLPEVAADRLARRASRRPSSGEGG